MIKGVRKLRLFQCSCNEEGEILRKTLTLESSYAQNGEALEEISFANEEAVSRAEQKLDENGRVSQILLFNDEGDCYHREEIAYSDKGKVQSRKVLYEEGAFELTTLSYDSSDRLIEEKTEDENGELSSRIIYEYDDKGRLINETCFDEEEGEVEWANAYAYLEDSEKLVKEERYGQGKELMEVRGYHYDEQGNRLQEKILWPEGDLKILMEYSYNADGLQEEVVETNYDNQRQMFRHYQYDDQGRIACEQLYQGEQLLQEITTEYDELGNPAKELQLVAVPGLGDYFAYTANVYEMEYW